MGDVFEALSKVSGLPKREVDAIWQGVKDNQRKLDSCTHPHDFEIISEPNKVVRNARCTKCGGTTSASCARWYIDGLKHAAESGEGE